MRSEIEEMKCPYCGDTASQEYGDIEEYGYDANSHYVLWGIDCPICGKHYVYAEEFTLIYSKATKD